MVTARLMTVAAVAGAAAIAGCGSSSGGDSAGSGAGAGNVSKFQSAAKQAQQPTTWQGPKDGPAAVNGKRVTVILCAAVAEGCVRIGNGVKEAGKALGWTVSVGDGQGKSDQMRSLMLQAIQQKVDGIVLAAIDSKTVGDAVTRARAAKIPVVSVVGGNKVGTSGSDVFGQPDAQAIKAGEQLGNWVAADSGGGAKVAMFHAPEFTDSRSRYEGSKSILSSCSGCKIVTDDTYAASTAAQSLPVRLKSTLQAHPEINYVWVDIGGYGALGVQAIKEMGKARQVKLVSFDCNLVDLKNIRAGSAQPACEGLGLEAAGWGGIDELNRAFNNAAPEANPIPIRVLTKDSLPAAGKAWEADFDFRSEYRKLWGLG